MMFLSDACQPEVDFLRSWAVVLPKGSGESWEDLLPPGMLKGKKGPDFWLSCVTQKRLFSSPLGTGRVVETFSQNRQITVFISFRVKRRLALLTDWKVTSCSQGIHTPLLTTRIFLSFCSFTDRF